ncbi:MAG: nicotinamide riboside transporter PnuC [Flavobacteriaceae bacterium]
MDPLFDFFFGQYSAYLPQDIVLELVGVMLGLASVWYAKQNKVAVYPTGMISTAIFVYLLWKWFLLGDMLINAYYFAMSVYGWYFWTQKKGEEILHPIAKVSEKERRLGGVLFLSSLIGVYFLYEYFDKWTSWTAYVDTFTTAIFFVGMWLMARRKIENWLFWILGDIISIPLYFYKGFTITSIQYIIFTIIAVYGYRAWKKELKLSPTA